MTLHSTDLFRTFHNHGLFFHIHFCIDSENDEILVACEEDFRLFLEQGKGRKIYFAVKQQEEHAGNNGEEAMDAEEIQQKCERRSSRKG